MTQLLPGVIYSTIGSPFQQAVERIMASGYVPVPYIPTDGGALTDRAEIERQYRQVDKGNNHQYLYKPGMKDGQPTASFIVAIDETAQYSARLSVFEAWRTNERAIVVSKRRSIPVRRFLRQPEELVGPVVPQPAS